MPVTKLVNRGIVIASIAVGVIVIFSTMADDFFNIAGRIA